MRDYQIAGRYTRALFSLARERGELEKIETDLTAVMTLLGKYRQIGQLLLNPTLSADEKQASLGKIMPENISRLLIHFLKVLIRKGRFKILGEVRKQFHVLFEKHLGIQEVFALTVQPLTPKLANRLEILLTEKLKSRIRLIPKADAEILGGLVLRFNGSEIDLSYRTRLLELKQTLLAS